LFSGAAVAAGEYVPILEVGANWHTGAAGKNIAGTTEYAATFRAEKRGGMFRSSFALDLGYAKGTASVGTDTPSAMVIGVGFLPGFFLFPFPNGNIQPFLGGSGVLGWHFFKMDTPPAGVEANTQGLSLGYEISAGVDLRFGGDNGWGLRLHSGLWSVTSTLAGQSGFQLNGFRLSLGFAY